MPDSEDKLKDYREKRDFRRTSEPSGEEVDFEWADERPIFVIQKHDASNLHYDLRTVTTLPHRCNTPML
ncbi:MAG: hypothetical protein ACP5JG_16510 [Anaerolineae bacterium]